MEFLADGTHVRMRSRVLGTYLRADGDGIGVSLSAFPASSDTEWVVYRPLRDGKTYFVFYGIAYDRYLCLTPGLVIRQRVCYSPEEDDILWLAISKGYGSEDVAMRHGTQSSYYLNVIINKDGKKSDRWVLEAAAPNVCFTMLPYAPDSADSVEAPDELLQDRAHVRLRSRVHGSYLYANEDGVYVSLSLRRATLNTAWTVHRVVRGATTYVLLHSASYGRYLSYSRIEPGALGSAAQNHYYHQVEQNDDIKWRAIRAQGIGDPYGSDDDVFLCNDTHGLWTARWVIEGIPFRTCPPLLPPPGPDAPGARAIQRRIWYVQGDGFGSCNRGEWKRVMFNGCSVSHLRNILAAELEEEHPERISLCVWSGNIGRLTPLVIDLPLNDDTMKVVVFESSTHAALRLGHPNIDAPA